MTDQPEHGGPAAGDEPLIADMRNWRERKRAIALTTIKVLHSDSDGDKPVYVRYGLVDMDDLQPALDAAEEAKDGEALLLANMDVLIRACQGVYIKRGPKDFVSIDGTGDAPRFDRRLGALFGLPDEATARMVCRHLFIAEPDILAHSGRVSAWSGMKAAEVDEDILGK